LHRKHPPTRQQAHPPIRGAPASNPQPITRTTDASTVYRGDPLVMPSTSHAELGYRLAQ
jgi:hypothetical protein